MPKEQSADPKPETENTAAKKASMPTHSSPVRAAEVLVGVEEAMVSSGRVCQEAEDLDQSARDQKQTDDLDKAGLQLNRVPNGCQREPGHLGLGTVTP